MLVYLNGEYMDRAEARVPVDDRGFLFGDGVYEVTRVVGGRYFEAPRHIRRMERGLQGLEIGFPAADVAGLFEVGERLLRENGLEDGEAYVYMQVTRGAATRTHHFPPAGTRPTVFVSATGFTPKTALCENGTSAVTFQDIRWARCDLKTVNLLPNVLAQQAAVAARADHAVFIRDGLLVEGAHANLFGVVDDELRTHPLTNQILPGITREVVLELAAELGIPTRESAIGADELPRVTELFMTGTTTDVMPLITLDGRPVGDGKPGPIARRLYAALRERMAGVGAEAAAG